MADKYASNFINIYEILVKLASMSSVYEALPNESSFTFVSSVSMKLAYLKC